MAYRTIPYTPVGRTALAGCCASCDDGGTCDSKLGDLDVKKTAHVAFMVAGAICLGLWLTSPKKKRR